MNLASDGSTLVRETEKIQSRNRVLRQSVNMNKKNTRELSGLRLEAEVGIILH